MPALIPSSFYQGMAYSLYPSCAIHPNILYNIDRGDIVYGINLRVDIVYEINLSRRLFSDITNKLGQSVYTI